MADIITSLGALSNLHKRLAEAASNPQSPGKSIMWMLGPFVFSRDTAAPQTLRQAAQYSWAAQERFGNAPLLQFTGAGAETIDLDGVIYPHYQGGLHQIAYMRELAGKGQPMILVDGRGNNYRQWSILSVEETGSVFLANGAARKIEFKVSLQRYVPSMSDVTARTTQ